MGAKSFKAVSNSNKPVGSVYSVNPIKLCFSVMEGIDQIKDLNLIENASAYLT